MGALVAVLFAQLQVAPRVHLIASGHLPARTLATTDDRATITARIKGGAAALPGFDAQPLAGDVALVRVTAEELRRLLQVPGLLQVDERRLFTTQLDRAAAAIGAPAARMESGLDGTGVLVGIVDTGADVTHADLRRADGSTKVLALLDVTVAQDARHADLGFYGGAIWLRDEIDGVLSLGARFPSIDDNGHGTHVAGIAVSTGLATGNGLPSGRYVGIAPGADLVVAKASYGGGQFTEGALLNGCRFVVDRANDLGRPLVLNLSLGGAGGAHDGTTNTEQALAALFPADTPGRIAIVVAGNEGLTDRHAGGWSLDGEADIPFHLAQPAAGDQVAIDLWSVGSPTITVFTPSGKQVGPVANGQVQHGEGTEGTVAVDHTTPPRADGRQPSVIVLTPGDGEALASGDWRIRLGDRAHRWDLWITEAAGAAHFTDHLDEDDRLGVLATTPSAISVGSFVSRSQWTTIDGKSYDRMIDVGVPSLFSSAGPSADNRFIPDVAAPGEFIISALSKDALPDMPTSDFYAGDGVDITWADDGVHGVLRGTSQAAPMVAGAVALLLQNNPTLTATQARELLRTSARALGAGWSPKSGFGAVDVRTLLALARGRLGQTVDAGVSSVGVSRDQLPPDSDDLATVTVTPRDATGLPLGPGHDVAITVSAGEPAGDVTDVGAGRYELPIRAHAGRGEVGVVTAVVDGVTLAAHPRIYYVIDRAEIGRPFSAGGGCSLGGRPPLISLLMLATLLWWRRSYGCSPRPPRL